MDSTIVIHFPAHVEYSAFNLIKIKRPRKKSIYQFIEYSHLSSYLGTLHGMNNIALSLFRDFYSINIRSLSQYYCTELYFQSVASKCTVQLEEAIRNQIKPAWVSISMSSRTRNQTSEEEWHDKESVRDYHLFDFLHNIYVLCIIIV